MLCQISIVRLHSTVDRNLLFDAEDSNNRNHALQWFQPQDHHKDAVSHHVHIAGNVDLLCL